MQVEELNQHGLSILGRNAVFYCMLTSFDLHSNLNNFDCSVFDSYVSSASVNHAS